MMLMHDRLLLPLKVCGFHEVCLFMAQVRQTFSVSVESWGASLQGNVRAQNQDSFLNWASHMLWAVADGVGSSEYGGAASRAIAKFLMQTPVPTSLDAHIDNVTQALRHANALFRSQTKSTGAPAASTAVALLIHEGSAACLWAGDSRCYIFRSGVLYQCTKDHTLRQKKIDRGELTAPEARRMINGNIITNAIGVHDELRLDEVRFSLRAGDRFLLCSDGLFTLIAPEALSACLTKPTAKEAVEGIVKDLEDMHQPDNITFVAIFLSELT
jgi:serine/threonine-protein phosphatase Stp1